MTATNPNRLGPNALWSLAGFPKKGWTHLRTIESPKGSQTCEACDAQTIVYVHCLSHPLYRDIEVGCVCAHHLQVSKAVTQKARGRAARASQKAANAAWNAKLNALQVGLHPTAGGYVHTGKSLAFVPTTLGWRLTQWSSHSTNHFAKLEDALKFSVQHYF